MARMVVPTLGGKQLWGDVFLHAGFRIQKHVHRDRHRLLDPRDRRVHVGTYDACLGVFRELRDASGVEPVSDHLVLLLHGIFRSKDSFGPMTRALRAAGFDAHAVNYPSTRQSVDAHADQIEALLGRVEGARRVSFVTHSMGGIITRTLLARRDAAWRDVLEVHRVVLIGTPNQGAAIAAHLSRVSPFRTVAGPALEQLAPDESGAVPPLSVPFAIIAGGTGQDRGYNPLLDGDNDMTVTVAETYLDGADDTLLVPAVHTFIMIHPQVVAATVRYLRTGSLGEPDDAPVAGPG